MGERIYREGILPSGEHLQAIVQDDIPVDGTMFTCVSCHLRSGLGSVEGRVITLPANGKLLFKPLSRLPEMAGSRKKMIPGYLKSSDRRPAYTDETLAAAVRMGVDPAGRRFNAAMPKYLLSDRDMEILAFYLRNLSASPSPGVTDSTLSFATVYTEGVGSADLEAMLAPLEAYILDRTKQAGYHKLKAGSGPFAEEMDLSYRRLSLARWMLKGPPETWQSQLEDYYRQEPVFALLGGISGHAWKPVHDFCERNRIPCILPITDFPVVSDADWYTLYFSKGLYQEGEAVARYLRRIMETAGNMPVIQVYRKTAEGTSPAKGFKETWERFGLPPAEDRILNSEEPVTGDFWEGLISMHRGAIIISWLGSRDISSAEGIALSGEKPHMLFVSSSLLDKDLNTIPENIRSFTYITYPYRLPQEGRDDIYFLVKSWLKVKNIPVTNLEISSSIYFLGWVLTDALMHMKQHYYRDYFLDVIDMMRDQTHLVANYPRLSFGQGQRFASKGCYIVQLTEGQKPELIKRSDWVIH
ncbi:MAG: ABC transporter substrate-binding protein [Nitrospirae bacterium]|nr:ABC transporter substrate-binding protein [Nitrospirota bacterium]